MEIETKVAQHYHHGALERTILDALVASGKDLAKLTTVDLAGVDEFHLGWHPATVALANQLALEPTMQLLDVGSGLGGPARYFAEAHGCQVVGIDLTDEYVAVANALTARCGLSERASFRQGSALALPFEAATFDVATLIHVGMNIEDKGCVFAEVRRVLKPGKRFAVFDVMRLDDSALPYPMPWAHTSDTSFVETPATYRSLLSEAGFAVESEHDQRELTLSVARQMRERAAKEGPPVLGLHTLTGPSWAERLKNVMMALERGAISPIAIMARAT